MFLGQCNSLDKVNGEGDQNDSTNIGGYLNNDVFEFDMTDDGKRMKSSHIFGYQLNSSDHDEKIDDDNEVFYDARTSLESLPIRK
jgi:hypothetical protein